MRSIRSFILPIYLPMVSLATALFAVLPGLPAYLGGIGAPVALVGTVVALRGLGTLVADLPAGVLLARLGERRIILLAGSILTAAMVALAALPVLIPTAIAVFAVGAATATFALGMQSYVRSTTVTRQRGKALSSVGGSLRIGALIGPAIGGVISGRLGMSWTFVFSAVCGSLALLLVARFLRREDLPQNERPDASDESSHNATGLAESLTVYRRLLTRPVPGMYAVGAAVLALSILRASREFVLPLWGGHIGLGVETIGYVMSAGAVFDLLLFVPAGLIMDRHGRKVAASLCIGLFSLGLALLPFTSGLYGFAAAAAFVGIANGLGSGINLTLGSDLAPADQPGHFLGLWRLFGDVGATLGPNIIGAVAALLALPAAIGAVAALGLVGTGVMLFVAPETSRHASRNSPPPSGGTGTPSG